MRTVTRYQAEDGSEWATENEASKRDALLAAIADASALLLPPVGDRKGYVQQDPAAVLAYKTRLLAIAKQVGVYGAADADPATTHNHGIMGRFIDDSGCTPLARAWWRLMATDDAGREWEQPYYALNPGKGPDVCLDSYRP